MNHGQYKHQKFDMKKRKEELYRLLVANERCTLAYLANSIGISTRTVKRYLDELEQDTVLVVYTGRNGGVSLANRAGIKHMYLKEYELEVLRRIISETEQAGQCVLDPTSIKILKSMTCFYAMENPDAFRQRRISVLDEA